MSKNIVLLVGGTSPERAVSKNSGKSILFALRSLGYNVRVIDPGYGLNQPENEEDYFIEKDYTELSNKNYLAVFNSYYFENVDLVFIGLHGKWGEDGTIQSLCELKEIPYTGSGVLTSALAMDKYMTKIMFQHFNVITPKWFIVRNADSNIDRAKDKINKFFGYPCVIKPNDQGSTVGLTICRGEIELEKAINSALEYSDVALIEEYIPGRELTVAVLDQQPLSVLEIKPKHGIYDYECKYTEGMSEYIVPADIPEETAEYLKRQALLAYNSVGCKNYARVDFRLAQGNKSFCLEVNTLPGMTNLSLVPKMAKAVGISFEELINKIVNYSLK
ncbi:MAG: D-alanine--D-alanine ligase [Melioribacteraceae bacterium]|nr:D-alanine--D-alanine ligase [Melioribacteraceae bacterium]